MGVGGIIKFILRRLIEIFFIGVLIALFPNLPPHANFSKPFTVSPAKPFTEKLALNNRLDGVEIWHKGDFIGPEAFADWNGELYASLYTGDIVKLTGEQHITPVVKFGKPCRGSYEESKCGRPLGLEFDSKGNLYAADSYYGLFKVDVKTGKKEVLVSPKTKIDGKQAKIFNSLTLASNGDIYWTDSSTDFTLEDGVYSFFADGSGRLIHYDAKTKRNRVLIDGLHFANGVALSEDEDFVIVAETTTSRILRYYLKGPKKGTHDVFIDGLPGMPDNLKSDGKGGFLVPLVLARDADHPSLFQSIGPFPLLRKAIARFLGVTEYIFGKIDELYPNEVCLKAMHYIGHFTMFPLRPPRTTLLRVNRNGEITDSVHNLNKKIENISEMHVFRDTLYLGSPFNDYVGRIPLSKIGWEDLSKTERAKRAATVESPKVSTTTTPPRTTTTTTTTPRPTTTTTTTPRPTTTTSKSTTTATTTPRPTTTTPRPTTTTQKPAATTQKPTTTTTQKPRTTTTQKPTTTTTQKPTTTTSQKPTTTPTQKPTTTTAQKSTTTTAQKPSTTTTQRPPTTTTQERKTTPPPPPKQQPPTKQASASSTQSAPKAEKVPAQQQKQAPPTKPQPKPAQGNKN